MFTAQHVWPNRNPTKRDALNGRPTHETKLNTAAQWSTDYV